MPIENGSISGYIVDAQGRININNLSTGSTDAASTRGALQRLFAALALPANPINAVGDWVDADDKTSDPGGAEATVDQDLGHQAAEGVSHQDSAILALAPPGGIC